MLSWLLWWVDSDSDSDPGSTSFSVPSSKAPSNMSHVMVLSSAMASSSSSTIIRPGFLNENHLNWGGYFDDVGISIHAPLAIQTTLTPHQDQTVL